MKVKEVLALAAANLGREDLVAQIGDCAGDPAGELSSLLRCYNLVENEIALDYFPLKHEECVAVEGAAVEYSALSFAPVAVHTVTGKNGRLAFEMRPARLLLPDLRGEEEVTVSYSYSPAEKEWDGECEFGENISARLLSFGVACEFCLTHGQYAEAATWEKRYREALRAASTPRRSLAVRSRRWI